MDVDDLANFLLMRDAEFQNGDGIDLDVEFRQGIKTLLFDAQIVVSGLDARKLAAAAEIGFASSRRKTRGLQKNACGRDRDAILVDYDYGG